MNATVSSFCQRTPPLEKKESRDDDGNDERFITTTKTQFCDEFSSAHARRVSEMMRVGVFFSPEKRLMMMRETKERERERKREKVRQNGKIKKPKNQKIPSSAAFSSSAFSRISSQLFRTTTRQKRKWGKKGPHQRRSSHRVLLLLKLLPYRIRYRAIPISFLFSLTTLSSSSCVAFWKSLIFRPPERIIIIIVFRNAVSYFNIIG